MTKRHALSFEERLNVYEFLKTVCKKNGEYAEYTHGWTDVSVAKHLGIRMPNVQSIRLSQFGKVREFRLLDDGKAKAKKPMKMRDRLEDLARRVEYLEKELGVTFEGNR